MKWDNNMKDMYEITIDDDGSENIINDDNDEDCEKQAFYDIINHYNIKNQKDFIKHYAKSIKVPESTINQSDISKKFRKYGIVKENQRYQIQASVTLQNWIIDEYIAKAVVLNNFKIIILYTMNNSANVIKRIIKKEIPPKEHGNYIFLNSDFSVVILCASQYCDGIVESIRSLMKESVY